MLDKKYNHIEVEKGKYDKWLKNDYFKSGDKSKPAFCIVIPPPNVTGKLHLGHAWDTALQDIIIRYKRLKGFDALWLPGMDHAGIATQAKVDAKLKIMGIKPREMDREEWLKVAWDWKKEYAENIHEQWATLGLGLDYSKERFTLDDGLSKAVRTVFVTLYNKGLIYKGERIINWDPEAKTALSNEEVIYKDVPGAFYHIKYYLEDKSDFLEIATTRPETLFGDTAVAVNPKDERYKDLIGKNVILPCINKLIPIIGDIHADPEFGTGIVKITPAHDPNDFEVGNRHNLERIRCINPDGTMNENALKYQGMDRFECREALIKDLEKEDLLIKIEPITHNVGHSERTDVMIEPYLSTQWFVKMDSLASKVLENQKDKDRKVNFVPARYEKILTNWMSDCHDWCISRQLWWGHRIPAWYRGEETYVGMEAPEGEGWVQDSDVLDTWFSSALWPFSTLGWPEETDDLKRYFPTSVLVTGYDIIFFWVCRMVFQSLEFKNERPFEYCLIHGLIRDKQGRKMSKSLGNGVDPMDMVDTYGADALRFYLTTSTAAGTDLRFDEDKIKSTWNFINKLWNASRFVLMNVENFRDIKLDNLEPQDEWILSKMNKTIKDVTKYMEKFEFNTVGALLYDFIWSDFCDNYIEMSKYNMDSPTTKSVLITVLKNILKMLHPFMPYVTDEIYESLDDKNITISSYPEYNKDYEFKSSKEKIDNVIEFVRAFRNVTAENNITKDMTVSFDTKEDITLITKLLKIEDKIVESDTKTEYKVITNKINATIYFDKVITEEDMEVLKKQKESLKESIKRRENLLSNENYVNKAPSSLVENERKTLESEKELLEKLSKEETK